MRAVWSGVTEVGDGDGGGRDDRCGQAARRRRPRARARRAAGRPRRTRRGRLPARRGIHGRRRTRRAGHSGRSRNGAVTGHDDRVLAGAQGGRPACGDPRPPFPSGPPRLRSGRQPDRPRASASCRARRATTRPGDTPPPARAATGATTPTPGALRRHYPPGGGSGPGRPHPLTAAQLTRLTHRGTGSAVPRSRNRVEPPVLPTAPGQDGPSSRCRVAPTAPGRSVLRPPGPVPRHSGHVRRPPWPAGPAARPPRSTRRAAG